MLHLKIKHLEYSYGGRYHIETRANQMDWFLYDKDLLHERVKRRKG